MVYHLNITNIISRLAELCHVKQELILIVIETMNLSNLKQFSCLNKGSKTFHKTKIEFRSTIHYNPFAYLIIILYMLS